MEQFREAQLQFFKDYQTARTIIDRSGNQSATPVPASAERDKRRRESGDGLTNFGQSAASLSSAATVLSAGRFT